MNSALFKTLLEKNERRKQGSVHAVVGSGSIMLCCQPNLSASLIMLARVVRKCSCERTGTLTVSEFCAFGTSFPPKNRSESQKALSALVRGVQC